MPQEKKVQTKHAEIFESMSGLGTARDGLQGLLNEITGEPSPPDETKTSSGTLLDFLNETGPEISKIANDLNRIRDELRVALF